MTYLYGLHTVIALLQQSPHRIHTLSLQEGRQDTRMQAVINLAKQAEIPIHYLSSRLLDEKTGHAVHQGVLAQIIPLPAFTESDLFELLDTLQERNYSRHPEELTGRVVTQKPPFLLILDGVQDPHNLGACIRSANAAGVDAVIAPKDKSAQLTAAVHKVAAGAAEITPFIQVTNLARTLGDLQKRGIWIYGLRDSAEKNIYNVDLKGPLALILGSEGKGLRRLTETHCDFLLKIPMQGTVSSLNVSVAAGICLYEVVRQRFNEELRL